MRSTETRNSLLPQLMTRTMSGNPPARITLYLGTLVPPLLALAIEFFVWPASGHWSLFVPAVFASAWLGGFRSGVGATLLSAALMWWFFVPPEHVLLKPSSAGYFLGLAFVGTSLFISAALERFQRTAGALARMQRLLNGIVQHSPNGLAIKDLDRRYIVVNSAFEQFEGLKREDVLQNRAEDVLPSPLGKVISDQEKQLLQTHAPTLVEATLDGRSLLISHFPLLDESQNMFAIGAMATDITEQKRDQDALRESLAELRIAEHVAHVGSWRWDFRTNTTTWSEELYEIFGVEHQQSPLPLLNPGLKLLTAESILRLTSAIDKLRKDGAPFEVDLEFTRPDGAARWCTARGEAIRDAEGRITGVAATAADITHIMRLERLREEWTSIIAHDLRQPIGVITSASGLIPEMHDIPADEMSMLRRIQSAAATLKRMVDDLLDVSLLEAHHLKLERSWIDPTDLVRETVNRTEPVTGGRVEIIESGPPRRVCVDPMRIEQVLTNLLSNAAKYGDDRTAIQVRLDRTPTEARIAVTNSGRGIPADELSRLFDRFARSRTTATGVPGLGLGLYISKEIIEAHGGRIWAESDAGKATTFHIVLPIAAARLEAA